jgi:hypothetical protein
MIDPMTYIGRVTRGDDGRVKTVDVIYDDGDAIELSEGDEFITFTTVIVLEEPR